MEVQAKEIASLFAKAFGLSFEASFYKAALDILSNDPDSVFWLFDYGEACFQRSRPVTAQTHLRLVR